MTGLWQSYQFYLWVKAFHVIAIIAWMAGMLYLPRLFVYHCETKPGSAESERFKVMERKLLRMIITPSMIVVWILGLTLSFLPETDAWHHGWFHTKFALVIAYDRRAWALCAMGEAVRERRKHTAGTVLSSVERSSDRPHDRDRDPRGG